MLHSKSHNISDYGLAHSHENTENYWSEMYDYRMHFKINSSLPSHYTWGEKSNKLYKKEPLWDYIFREPEPIIQKSISLVSEITRVFNDGKTEKNPNNQHTSKKFVDMPEYQPSGYITTFFSFLGHNLYGNPWILDEQNVGNRKKAYQAALDAFDLNGKHKVPATTYAIIGNYRDTLLTQIQRQATEFQNYNRKIANILKVIYYETERAITVKAMNNSSKDEINSFQREWESIRSSLIDLHRLICEGKNFDEIKEKTEWNLERYNDLTTEEKLSAIEPYHFWQNKYFPDEILNETLEAIIKLMAFSNRVFDYALLVGRKILPAESLLYDFIKDEEIKSIEKFKQSITKGLTKDDIYRTADALKKDGMTVDLMYEHMQKWLHEDLELSNKDLYDRFKFTLEGAQRFNRTINKYLSENRNKIGTI